MTSEFYKRLSRRTKILALVAVSPVPAFLLYFGICLAWSETLKTGTTDGTYFDWCGHDALLPNLVLGILVVIALFCLLATPISFLVDRRKWKFVNQ